MTSLSDSLTVSEAAALLGCSPVAIRRRLAEGALPGTKKGKMWFVDVRVIRRIVRDCPPASRGELTAVEAAAELGVALVTVHQWLARGQLRGRKCYDGTWAIGEADIRTFRPPRPGRPRGKKR